MVATERLMHLIFRVAQIDAVDVAGDGSLDHIEIGGGHFLMLRSPGAVEIRVIAGAQGCLDGREAFDLHGRDPFCDDERRLFA